MEKLLHSKCHPSDQDHIWHLQVLYFMNWQSLGIKRQLEGKAWPSRKTSALNVAIVFKKGQQVQERILKHEKLWIQKRRILVSKQGKNAKMMCMLEDEGTMMVVQECIASAGASMFFSIL